MMRLTNCHSLLADNLEYCKGKIGMKLLMWLVGYYITNHWDFNDSSSITVDLKHLKG